MEVITFVSKMKLSSREIKDKTRFFQQPSKQHRKSYNSCQTNLPKIGNTKTIGRCCMYIFYSIVHFSYKRRLTLQRKNAENLKQIFPEKEYRGLSPNFHIHVSVSELYIPTIELPFLLEEICGPILGIYKSLTDT